MTLVLILALSVSAPRFEKAKEQYRTTGGFEECRS